MACYDFYCDKCDKTVEVECPMSEAGNDKFCECGCLLKRIYEPLVHKWDNCEWPGGWKGSIDSKVE